MFYVYAIETAVEVWNCVDNGIGNLQLSVHPAIDCTVFAGPWPWMLFASIAVVVFFVLFVNGMFAIVLKNVDPEDPRQQRK